MTIEISLFRRTFRRYLEWLLAFAIVVVLTFSLFSGHIIEIIEVRGETQDLLPHDGTTSAPSTTEYVVNIHLFGSASKGWGLTADNITSPGPRIAVKEGDLVNLTLTSADGNIYNFFVDYNGNKSPDVSRDPMKQEPKSPDFRNTTVNYQFNAILAGNFTYRCLYRYFQYPEDTMSGEFVVYPIPTPGYYETNEYAMGSYAVGVILVESNGTIDPDTEDWNSTEEQQCLEKIQYALDWWASQNPYANLSFVLDVHYRVPTSYEPISLNLTKMDLWGSQVMTNLGYPQNGRYYMYQIRDYINDLRMNKTTDWGFVIFVVDASNDQDGSFSDGWSACALNTREAIILPVKPLIT
jgi:hypothetical protein